MNKLRTATIGRKDSRRRPSRRRVARSALAAMVGVSGLALAAATTDTESPTRFSIDGGAAWVASWPVGHLTLLDGNSAEVAARVEVGEAGARLLAAQHGRIGYAANIDSGTVTRVDPATMEAGAAIQLFDGDPLGALHAGAEALYSIDVAGGRLAVTDPDDPGSDGADIVSVAEEVAASVVDGDGRLWVIGATTGDVRWFDRNDRGRREEAVDAPGATQLVLVRGEATAVDLTGRSVYRIESDGSLGHRACIDIQPGDDTVHVGGSDRSDNVYVVSGSDGLLRQSNVATGVCDRTPIRVGEAGSDLGAPHTVGSLVFVANYSTGTVAVVDVAAERVFDSAALVPPGVRFELIDEGGILFFNDAASERAGVVRTDGTVRPIAKYDPANPNAEVTPPDGEDPQSELPEPGQTTETTTPESEERTDKQPDNQDTSTGQDPPLVNELNITAGSGQAAVGVLVPLEVVARDSREAIESVEWSFGDGTTTRGEHRITHAWTTEGSFPIAANVVFEDGRTGTAQARITITRREVIDSDNDGVPDERDRCPGAHDPEDSDDEDEPDCAGAPSHPLPEVVGLTLAEAQQQLAAACFTNITSSQQPSDVADPGTVIEISPASGTEVACASPVTLVVSQGPLMIPDVTGHPVAEATSILGQSGYGFAGSQDEPSATVPAGRVIRSDPPPGTTAPRGTAVTLIVSAGPPTIPVPDVTNASEAEARQTLTAAGFVLAIEPQCRDAQGTQEAGHVALQNPAPNQPAATGSTVTLTLVCASEIPDVTGRPVPEATNMLGQSGYAYAGSQQEPSTSVPAGRVIRSDPPPGTSAPRGAAVTLVVSSGPPSTAVPPTSGLSEAAAKQRLSTAGLAHHSTMQQSSSSVGAGLVIRSDPPQGTSVPLGTPVRLIVSSGPPPRTPPCDRPIPPGGQCP